MKIDNNYTNPMQSQKSENAQAVDKSQRQSEKATQAQQSPQRDSLVLSDKARLLSKARTALDEAPEVNSSRVEELKESVRQGNYQVNFNELAKKMVGNVDVKG
jgi:flagellar biosynthesis anti-sigma factor FlgM